MSTIKHKYAINFDLHTNKNSEIELKKYVGISLNKMYKIIKEHLCNNGFEWVQGSGYITKKEITSRMLTKIVTELYDDNQWLGYFTRDIKRTIVDDNTYTYDSMIDYYSKKFRKNSFK